MADSGSLPPEGPRFAQITPTDHSGYVWATSPLCLVYSVLALTVRGHIKWNLLTADDTLVALATVRFPLPPLICD